MARPASFEFEEVVTKRFWWFSLALFVWSPRVPLLPPASPDGAEGGPDTCRSGEKDGKGGSDPGAMGRAVLGQDWWLLAPGLVTNSILFCGLFTIEDRCK